MHPGTSAFEARFQLTDIRQRPLFINVKVTVKFGGVFHISVYAPYWIVNRTGLLFSFAERDSNQSIVAIVEIFKHLILTVKNITLNIEEEMVYKLYKFLRSVSEDVEGGGGGQHRPGATAGLHGHLDPADPILLPDTQAEPQSGQAQCPQVKQSQH